MIYIDLYDIHIRAVSWHNSWMFLHGSGPWLVNLWHRWCLGNMFLSLQPIGHDHGPHRAQVSPFLAEFLSDLVESQFPQSDGKVLHRSAQNGTGARKEMCRCADARAEPCQKNTTNITSSENMREHGGWFHLISRLWPNPALRRSKTRVN